MKNRKLTLYHFTNRNNIELILKSNILEAGKHVLKGKIENKAICFTDDPDPIGHGLTDGRPISAVAAIMLNYYTEKNGEYYCIDNTEFYLKLNIHSSKSLINAVKLHKKRELDALAITGHLPCSPQPTDEELLNTVAALKSGLLNNKSTTWWYYFGDLVLSNYEVFHKQEDGSYVRLERDSQNLIDLSSIPAQKISSLSCGSQIS